MVRLRGGWLSLLGVTLGATLGLGMWPAPAPSPVQAAEPAPLPRFDPSVVKPASGSVLEAVLRARANADRETARSLAMAALPFAVASDVPALRWIAADGARAADVLDEAAELLFPVAISDHPLAPWAKLRVSEWLEVKDPGRALAMLDVLLVPSSELETFPGKVSAERLRARVLAKLGRRQEAIAAFEHLLADAGDESAALQLLMPLAELLATGSEPERVRAVTLCHKAAARVPETRLGRRAEELATSLRAGLPAELLQSLSAPGLEQALTRAETLLKALKYKEALAAFDVLERESGLTPQLSCRARFGRAKALLDSRARTPGVELMAQVAGECPYDSEQRVWARYQAGRAFSALGQNEAAIAQYEALEREAPEHRLADDALYRAAKVAHDMGDAEGALERLKLLPQRYPRGDMQPRARFALALQAAAHGDLAAASAALTADLRDEAGEDLQGRASYFRARFLAQQGKLVDAIEGYAATIKRTPLSYYGMLALSRLDALDPARAKALAPRLAVSLQPADEALTFEHGPMLHKPGFERALALLSAGEPQLGLGELRALGFLEPSADPELTWLSAALLDRGAAPHLALDLVRRRMPELLARPPVGRTLALYRLVYPQAFSPLIEDSALRESVPPAFVRAVAREESGFYPKAVSRSGAHGLIQLLEATAKAISKGGMKLPTHPAALQEPSINLALGTRFTATLAASVRGQFALVPAAYNAGPAAAGRWLAQRNTEPLDVWIENIPYDETRSYSRRVLQTYGVYHWLATGEVLRLPERLPLLPAPAAPAEKPISASRAPGVSPDPAAQNTQARGSAREQELAAASAAPTPRVPRADL
jgi:soluble lytic murein transglycosylase